MKHWQANEKWTLGKVHLSRLTADNSIVRVPENKITNFKKIVCKRNIEIKSSNVEKMMMDILLK